MDKSNKSYYGETTLYLLSAGGGFDARIPLDKEGPIHDVSWSPNSTEFAVVYGYMPAKTTIFNHRAVATHSLPIGPRNTVIFSPTGRFMLVAGFGNLAGQIDVYDLEKDHRKVCTIESGNPSVCQWSPDSRYLMTATTSPRLRVDNGVKLWHVGGGIVYNEDMVELYSVMWRPLPASEEGAARADPLHPVPVPHASALTYLGTIKTPSKPAGAYRPPGARGTVTPLHFKREDEGGAAHVVTNGPSNIGPNGFGRPRRQVPGAELVEGVPGAPAEAGAEAAENLSKAALKNKKKRGNKKAREADGVGPAEGASLAPPPPHEYGSGSGHEGRSPERRSGQHRHSRSQSRNNMGRNRSNTQRNRDEHSRVRGGFGHAPAPAPAPAPATPAPVQYENAGAVPVAVAITAAVGPDGEAPSPIGQNPTAKKMRSLQKKLRAIEDLEMRHAGGEKLEDTQMKKIATKVAVLKELETLEKEPQQA